MEDGMIKDENDRTMICKKEGEEKIRVLQLEVHSQDFVTIHPTKEHTEWMLQ